MASLTPLSKGLIGLAVLGAMASAVWHLGLKERLQSDAASVQQPGANTPMATPTETEVPKNVQIKALSTAGSAAENAEAGRKLLDSGNPAQARVHLEQAVQGGDGAAACLLGEMTLKGQGGLAANPEKAAKLFQLAQSRNIICFASGQ